MIIADSMLGKLARYLRIIGYDVKYIEKDKDDSYIISISENNLILTRDKLLHGKLKNSVLIESHDSERQLAELKGALPAPEHRFMELCSICGHSLESVENRIELPEYVNKDAKQIFRCNSCNRYYWNGSHMENFRKMVERVGFEIHD